MTISLCMIVKDEAATLGRALESVQGVVDEIIVVDTGSEDETVAIAQSWGAQVSSFAWVNDFAAARNVSLSQATGDWVLVLDADEVLLPETAQILRQLDQGQPWGEISAQDILAVNLLRLEVGAAQAPYTLITRFFRRLPEITFNRPYHETVDDSIADLQGQNPRWQVVTLTAVALNHTGYDPAVVVQRGKFDRARTTMEQYLAQHPDDGYILNKLAALYLEANQIDQALPLLNQALAQDDTLDPITHYELHYHRALALEDQPDQAAQAYQAALSQPVLPILKVGAWINYGSMKKNQGALAEAIDLFDQAIAADPTLAIGYYNLGTAHRARGYLDDAIAAYQQAISLRPNYAEAHQNLAVALFKLGQVPESLQSFNRAIQLYESYDPDQARSLKQGVQKLGIPPALLGAAHLL
jgi:tetratricopeptide (TPR) repeat protein